LLPYHAVPAGKPQTGNKVFIFSGLTNSCARPMKTGNLRGKRSIMNFL
jgi:hypothetical protein